VRRGWTPLWHPIVVKSARVSLADGVAEILCHSDNLHFANRCVGNVLLSLQEFLLRTEWQRFSVTQTTDMLPIVERESLRQSVAACGLADAWGYVCGKRVLAPQQHRTAAAPHRSSTAPQPRSSPRKSFDFTSIARVPTSSITCQRQTPFTIQTYKSRSRWLAKRRIVRKQSNLRIEAYE
jgi:hypothetical protein